MNTQAVVVGLARPGDRLADPPRPATSMALGTGGGQARGPSRPGLADPQRRPRRPRRRARRESCVVPPAGQALVEAWDDERAGARRLAAGARSSTASRAACAPRVRPLLGHRRSGPAHRRRRRRRGGRARRRRAAVRPALRGAHRELARAWRPDARVLHNGAGASARSASTPAREQEARRCQRRPRERARRAAQRSSSPHARPCLTGSSARSSCRDVLRAWLVGRRETIDRRLLADQGRVRSAARALPLERGAATTASRAGSACRSPTARPSSLRFHVWYPGCETELDAYDIPKPKDTDEFLPQLLVVPCLGFGPGGVAPRLRRRLLRPHAARADAAAGDGRRQLHPRLPAVPAPGAPTTCRSTRCSPKTA